MKRFFLFLSSFTYPWILFVGLAGCQKPETSFVPEAPAPVLLISIDTCRADYLSMYGSSKIQTPALDALAQEGIVFEDAVTLTPLTLPAHATLLTGLHPIQHGARDNFNGYLPDEAITLAELYQDAGYTTAGVVGALLIARQNGFAQGFDFFDDQFDPDEFLEQKATVERTAEKVVASASQWLLSTPVNQPENPFFLFMHFYDPHMVYSPPAPFWEQYASDLYGGEIAYVDHCLGEFIVQLKAMELYDAMWIVVVGDHGEGLGDHKEQTHGLFLYDECVRVPFVVKPPKALGLPIPSRVSHPVSLADLVPTLSEISGLAPLPGYGESVLPWIIGVETQPQARWFAMETLYPLTYNWSPLFALRGQGWKYIHAPKPELYHVADDPGEKENRVASDSETAADYKSRLESALVEIGMNRPFQPQSNPQGDKAELLASLGYVGGGAIDSSQASLDQNPELRDPKDMVDVCMQIDQALGYVVQNEYMKAIDLFVKAMRQDPANPSPVFNLGMVYGRMGNLEMAIRFTRKGLQLAPKSVMVEMQLSRLYILNEQYDLATEILQSLVQRLPHLADAFFQLGEIEYRQNRPEAALVNFKKAQQWMPGLPGLEERIEELSSRVP
jgi:arylsulfatase A-like enzyme